MGMMAKEGAAGGEKKPPAGSRESGLRQEDQEVSLV